MRRIFIRCDRFFGNWNSFRNSHSEYLYACLEDDRFLENFRKELLFIKGRLKFVI